MCSENVLFQIEILKPTAEQLTQIFNGIILAVSRGVESIARGLAGDPDDGDLKAQTRCGFKLADGRSSRPV